MDITIGSLELNRSHEAHLGNAPLLGQKQTPGVKTKGLFESYLLDAVNEMNAQQVNVTNLQKAVVTDPDSVDIHDVTTAMAKAKMSLDLAQTVIDRLVSGWNELSQNR